MPYNYSQYQPGYYQGNGNGYAQQNPYYPTAVDDPTATPTPLINVVDGSLSIRRSA